MERTGKESAATVEDVVGAFRDAKRVASHAYLIGCYELRGERHRLQALRDNDKGHLYSIDLPNVTYEAGGRRKIQTSDMISNGKPSRFSVPTTVRYRWTLIVGDAKTELPLLIEKLDKVDLFSSLQPSHL